MNAQHAVARAVAWAGALLFAAALAFFLFSYSVTFAEITPSGGVLAAVTFDAALFTVFALHHSVFARDAVRASVRRLVTPLLERSVYVWVASLMLIGVCYAWRPVPGTLWQVPAPWSWPIHLVQAVGVWLTLRSAAVIDALDLAGVRQVLQSPSRSAPQIEFKTDGPYGWVRHPIYLGWILIVFGVGTMTMTRFVFAGVSTLYLLLAIPFEERTIQGHSAGAYQDYVKRVPWKLIPRVY